MQQAHIFNTSHHHHHNSIFYHSYIHTSIHLHFQHIHIPLILSIYSLSTPTSSLIFIIHSYSHSHNHLHSILYHPHQHTFIQLHLQHIHISLLCTSPSTPTSTPSWFTQSLQFKYRFIYPHFHPSPHLPSSQFTHTPHILQNIIIITNTDDIQHIFIFITIMTTIEFSLINNHNNTLSFNSFLILISILLTQAWSRYAQLIHMMYKYERAWRAHGNE